VKTVYERPASLTEFPFTYCPGCSHGLIHKLLAEVIDELKIREKSVGVTSIGCSVRAWKFIDTDMVQGAHGRGMAVATGLKRALPEQVIFTYQGDGDLISIGMAETMHAAARGENITVIFVNNAVFGATGGQMAPTTLLGQVTSSSPGGRDVKTTGHPIKMAEQLALLESTAYITRVAINNPSNIRKTKKAIKKAFENQIAHKGFSLVEILGICPTNLRKSPVDSLKWLNDQMIPVYPLGDLKVPEE
jgi:2-oxoglutarate/2-oxoacid ferredoxin oxidoreductase subunit beta